MANSIKDKSIAISTKLAFNASDCLINRICGTTAMAVKHRSVMSFRFCVSLMCALLALFSYGDTNLEGKELYQASINGINWTYILNDDNTVSIGGGRAFVLHMSGNPYIRAISTATAGEVEIPAYVNGRKVTSISDGAFYTCSYVSSVKIPDGVVNIGLSAFQGCSSLMSVDIPEGVVSIGYGAFQSCGLTSVLLPQSVKTIGNEAFLNSGKLRDLNLPTGVESVGASILTGTSLWNSYDDGVVILDGCLLGVKGECPAIVNIPNSVRLIATSAFKSKNEIVSVSIPSGVKEVGSYAFSECNELSVISIAEGVEHIGSYAFYKSPSIETISIPASVTEIGDSAFSGCDSLLSINVETANQNFLSQNGLLYNKQGDRLLVCPAGLSLVKLPEGVVSVENSAFSECKSLSAIELPTSLKNIGSRAFYNCGKLNSIIIPQNVESVGERAFESCVSLSWISLLSTINYGGNMFSGCGGLKYVLVRDGRVSELRSALGLNSDIECFVAEHAANGLRFAEYEDGTLAALGFEAGVSADRLDLPNEIGGKYVSSIMRYAFEGCEAIKEVVIPSMLKKIGKGAFDGCRNIRKVYWNNNWDGEIRVMMNDNVWGGGYNSYYKQYIWTSPTVAKDNNSSLKIAVDNISQMSLDLSLDPSDWNQSWRFYVDGELITSYGFAKNLTQEFDRQGHVVECAIYVSWGSGSTMTVKLSDEGERYSAFKDWFSDANELDVYLGEQVSRLPEGLFAGCKNVKSITLSKSVASIGRTTFYGCESLQTIDIPDSNPYFVFQNGCLLSKDGCRLIWSKYAQSIVIPQGVRVIESCAFAGNRQLRSLYMPSGVEQIDNYAFDGCANIMSLSIPASVSLVGRNSFPKVPRVDFLGDIPSGFDVSGLQKAGKILVPRRWFAKWKSYANKDNFATRYMPTVTLLTSSIRETDPTIMDVEYIVTSDSPTVRVGALAFKNGVRSFANVVRPETFVDGTAANIGEEVAANVPHKLSWRVSADYGIELTKMKFEVIAQEGDLLPMEWIYIPKSDQYGKMKASYNTLSEVQVYDALMWLYAAKDSGLTLSGGVLKGGGYTLANGASSSGTSAVNYVFSKMGWTALSGAVLNYVNSETRKGLSPSGVKQYAYQIVE